LGKKIYEEERELGIGLPIEYNNINKKYFHIGLINNLKNKEFNFKKSQQKGIETNYEQLNKLNEMNLLENNYLEKSLEIEAGFHEIQSNRNKKRASQVAEDTIPTMQEYKFGSQEKSIKTNYSDQLDKINQQNRAIIRILKYIRIKV
jgi:hypothetical protein